MKRVNKRAALLGAAIIAWLGFIFSNSLKSRTASAAQSESAEGLFSRLLAKLGIKGDLATISEIVVRKAAHVFEFFVLALLVCGFLKVLHRGIKRPYTVAALFSVGAAATDECLQILSSRGASVRDVLIDSIGVALGLGLFKLAQCRLSQKSPKNE